MVQNCCNGLKCGACDERQGLTQECLRQCAPIDAMDTACAKHKECSILRGDSKNPIPGCYPGAPAGSTPDPPGFTPAARLLRVPFRPAACDP